MGERDETQYTVTFKTFDIMNTNQIRKQPIDIHRHLVTLPQIWRYMRVLIRLSMWIYRGAYRDYMSTSP